MQKIDELIFILVVMLMVIGALFSFSLPVFLENFKDLDDYFFVKRYVLYSIIGIVIILILSARNPDKFFEKIGFTIFILSSILVILMPIIPDSIAPTINGAKRWIKLGAIKFAPVEFFKIGVIFFLSWSFTRKVNEQKISSVKDEIILIFPYIIVLGIFWLLILVFQSDLGQVMVMGILFALILFVSGGQFKTLTLFISGGLLIFVAAVLSSTYRLERFEGWLHSFTANFLPFSEVTNLNAYSQVTNALNAIYHGGFSGVGIGNGVFKLGFVSDVHTDFVLAGIAEETGLFGILLVINIFIILVYRIYRIAIRNQKKEYQLFAFGVGSLIAIQFLMNGFGVTSVIPIKGITVPFLSYGGSSLLSFSVAIGMVLMVSKKAKT